jgi:hypothetical protein
VAQFPSIVHFCRFSDLLFETRPCRFFQTLKLKVWPRKTTDQRPKWLNFFGVLPQSKLQVSSVLRRRLFGLYDTCSLSNRVLRAVDERLGHFG